MRRDLTNKVKRLTKKYEWHRWFAWYPIRLRGNNDTIYTVWLEYVQRKRELCGEDDDQGYIYKDLWP